MYEPPIKKEWYMRLLMAVAAILISCVAIDRNNPDDPGSENYVSRSSSAVMRSSSSVAGASSSSVEEREHYGKMKPQFVDARDGKKYVYVNIGNQTWMAENLKFNASGSKCYDNNTANCDTYGRLYDWAAAQTACPNGWRLPGVDDWDDMRVFINPLCADTTNADCSLIGTKLKTTSGWNNDENGNSGNGTDDYGFSALPGGNFGEGSFDEIGEVGVWWTDWTSDDEDANTAYFEFVIYNAGFLYTGEFEKSAFFSVRCVRY